MSGTPLQRGSKGDLMLAPAVLALFPTPTAMDSHGSGGKSPADVTLTDAVIRTRLGTQPNPRHEQVMPTPTAADAERTSHVYPGGNSTLLGAATDVMPLLPSPSVADADGGHTSRSGDRKDELLLPKIARSIGESTAQLSADGS